jgi:hypothetical protein
MNMPLPDSSCDAYTKRGMPTLKASSDAYTCKASAMNAINLSKASHMLVSPSRVYNKDRGNQDRAHE